MLHVHPKSLPVSVLALRVWLAGYLEPTILVQRFVFLIWGLCGVSLHCPAFSIHLCCIVSVFAGNRLQPTCALRRNDYSFSANEVPDTRLFNVLLGASVAARVVLAFSSQHSHSSTSSHHGHDHHHSQVMALCSD